MTQHTQHAFHDADLERAAEVSTRGRLLNVGQSCIAPERFIVVDKGAAALRNAVRRAHECCETGRSDERADGIRAVGPTRSARCAAQPSRKKHRNGGPMPARGKIPNNRGAYYPPPVLTDVAKG